MAKLGVFDTPFQHVTQKLNSLLIAVVLVNLITSNLIQIEYKLKNGINFRF